MSKHGTASVSGLFVELMKAVMSALPRNLPEDIAEEWTKNGAALKRALQQALMPPPGERVVMSALDVSIAGIVRALQQFFWKKKFYELCRIDEFFYTVRESENISRGGMRRVWINLTVPGWWHDHHHIEFRLDQYESGGWRLSDPIGIFLHPRMQMAGVIHIKVNDIPMSDLAYRFVECDEDTLQYLRNLDNNVGSPMK